MEKNITQYDLTDKICNYLDPHMIQIVLSWLKRNKTYESNEIDNYINLINETCEKEIIQIENEFTNGNRSVINNCLESFENEINDFQNLMILYKNTESEKTTTIEKKTVPGLLEWANEISEKKNVYKFSNNIDEQILKLSRYYYQKKDYVKSKQYLIIFILNISEIIINVSDSPKMKTSYWGIISNIINTMLESIEDDEKIFVKDGDEIFVNEVLLSEVNACIETFVKLSQLLNKEKLCKNLIILQRSWLIHWSLFLIFHFFFYMIHMKKIYLKGNAFPTLQEWFVDEKNMTIINLICPHIIRYYCVYFIFNRNRKEQFQLLINTLRIIKPKYQDPFTSLIMSIFIDYDFNIAQKCISEIGEICERDIFLFKLKHKIEEQCRYIIFETYCKIHKSINIDMLASKLNLQTDEAEKWIVNLIRNAKLDAKINSEKNCIEIQTNTPNLYQQIVDKTQNMIMRCNYLVQHINKTGDEHFQKNTRFKNKNDKNKNMKRNKLFKNMYAIHNDTTVVDN